jgi:hypothetical protein
MNDYIIELPELFNVSNNKSMIMFIKGFGISVLELNQQSLIHLRIKLFS